MRCEQCDAPKTDAEPYEMPGDTTAAPSVTDAALLRVATAGPNWRCAYCGSDQRADDGSCRQCGASEPSVDQIKRDLVSEAIAATPRAEVPVLTPWGEIFRWGWQQKLAVTVAAAIVAGVAGYLWVHRERSYAAKVEDVHWTQMITVERYTIWNRNGWRDTQPSEAFDVVSKGQQIRDYDHVLDGYTTEHYTEQVACGQDCTETATSCHEVCTDNRNGFASCHDVCSGGGRSCTPKWCTETRSRDVPRYKDVARYAEAIEYKIWDWGDQRSVTATGHGTTGMGWPSDAHTGEHLAEREQEREKRSATYEVTIGYDDKHVTFPVGLAELPKFEVGTKHELHVKDDRVIVDGKRVENH
jgi:hypothetical protein